LDCFRPHFFIAPFFMTNRVRVVHTGLEDWKERYRYCKKSYGYHSLNLFVDVWNRDNQNADLSLDVTQGAIKSSNIILSFVLVYCDARHSTCSIIYGTITESLGPRILERGPRDSVKVLYVREKVLIKTTVRIITWSNFMAP
jgi:hypothetical protein